VALMPSAENPENSQCDDAQGERHEVWHAPRDNVPTPPLHVKKMQRARDCF